ncbi:MAG TPA: hypothetical protein VHB70_19385 [Parafilimonas sp.]|nr:hypothetical protein [Parafilimonas sp.]
MSTINNNREAYNNDFSFDINTVNHNDEKFQNTNNINEEQWIHILFLVSDTQIWLEELQTKLIYQLPVKNKKKLLRKSHYLSASALAHILERHYFKIPRYPNAGKFTISVAGIVSYLRDAGTQITTSINNSCNVQRVIDAKQLIGFDKYGKPASVITVISDSGGKIITAFPGTLNS